jgi:alpha-glucosidase (family GH31 glycosyl hydrolase)
VAAVFVAAALAGAGFPARALPAAGAAEQSRMVVDGPARFEVLTPTLIRLEYASDRRFEDGTTFTVVTRDFPVPPFRTTVEEGWRVVRTAALTLRYREGSGPFRPQNTSITLAVDGRPVVAHPWPDPAAPGGAAHNLGGWQRSFDIWSYRQRYACTPPAARSPGCRAALPPLHDGLLSTDGWYLLDDTHTALWTPGAWPRPRPRHAGATQDGYFFGYGHDYRLGLHELAQLTGPAPLPPRWMFGVLYSGCCIHSEADYERQVVPQFHTERVPLDAVIIDTQWKTSTPGHPPALADDDGWSWSPHFFPHPQQFLDWAHAQGVHVALNVHPTIEDVDPKFAEAARTAGGLIRGEDGEFGWNWADPRHVVSFSALHSPFTRQGVDLWWLDWCCDRASRVAMPGLTPDAWIDHLYADELTAGGARGVVLARIGSSTQRWADTYPSGAWADHRYAVHFTGDTWSTWNTLAFESLMTIREGNIGLPYVSHDIGGYLGPPPHRLPDTDDLYARWVQFGAFQPVLRLHGVTPRLPWEYGAAARASADEFLQLRETLIPYTYTTAREAYDSGLPMVRGLYLDAPDDPMAYRFDQEYMFGDEMLVAPVVSPGAVASMPVWFPPGGWIDLFTGRAYRGPAVATVASPLHRMPVFVRAGAILPLQPGATSVGSAATTLLRVFAGGDGSYRLYDDAGEGLGYTRGEDAWTPIIHEQHGADSDITVGAAQGTYPGQADERSLAVDLVGVDDPDGVRLGPAVLGRVGVGSSASGWWYDALTRTLHIGLGRVDTHRPVHLAVLGAHPAP